MRVTMTKYYFNDNQKNIVRLMAQGLQDSSVQPTWTVVRGDDRIMAAWGPSQELSREIEEGRLQEPELDIFIDSGLVKRLSGDEYFLRWQQIIEAANNDFEDPINIELEPVQKDLLFALVEAARNVPNEHRREFSSDTELGLGSVIYHPGLNEGKRTVSLGDLHILQNERLISTFAQNKYDLHFEV